MSRLLADLDPSFLPDAEKFLARLTEAQIPVLILCTRRTAAEQAAAVVSGHSQVTHSRHQDGMAIDVCPWDVFDSKGADKLDLDTTDPVWVAIGKIAEGLGLRWGGRFHPLDKTGMGWDPGHVERPGGG